MTEAQALIQLIGAASQIGLGFVFLVQWWIERAERVRLTQILIERDQNDTEKLPN